MKPHFLFVLLLCSLFVNAQKRKALLIGIDGLQFEKLKEIETPNFEHFNIKKGFTGGVHGTRSQQITSSGPGWMTILTGVWADQHGIVDNSQEKLSKVPSVFKYLKDHNNSTYLASISTWKEINIFLKDDLYATRFSAQGGNDVLSTQLVIQQIDEYDADFSFLHLDDIDHAGHAHGFGNKYNTAIQRIDKLLGNILEVVHAREHKFHEDWLVILVTDHGRDTKGFSHGAQEVSQKTIFIGLNKPGNAYFQNNHNEKEIGSFADLEGLLPQTSVVPTLLKHFKVPIQKKWKLDGKPLID